MRITNWIAVLLLLVPAFVGTAYAQNISAPNVVSTGSNTIYTSQLLGTTGAALVAPGSSAVGKPDRAAALNAALAPGNLHLIIDGQYAIGSHLNIHSNTLVTCLPGDGLIMLPGANDQMFQNANPAAPTTASGTGGYVVSNITDHDISIDPEGVCTWNQNSTEAIVSSYGDHKTAPNGLWVTSTQFFGVSNLTVGGHWYDSATFNLFYANVEHGRFKNNWVQAASLNGGKNNDGVHAIGPAHDIVVTSTKCTLLGDDCVAFNADDGNEPALGDSNASRAAWANLKWGPITDSSIDGVILDNSIAGIRLLSVTERIDNITVQNVSGSTGAQTFTLSHEYANALGNYGTIKFKNISGSTSGSYNNNRHATWWVGGNYDALIIDGESDTNHPNAYPLWNFIDGTLKTVAIKDLTLTNSTGVDANFMTNTATIRNLRVNGVSWVDSSTNTGTLLGGNPPAALAASNCNIPNRLTPTTSYATIRNGDCFTNTFGSPNGTTYINTTFTEGAANALLAGTTPTVNSGSGWVQAAGGPSSGNWSYTGSSGAQITGGCTGGGPDVFCPLVISAGHSDYVMRVNVAQQGNNGGAGLNFVVRWTDVNNFETFLPLGGQYNLCHIVAGATTCPGTGSGITVANGLYTITVTGNTATLTNSVGTISGTMSSGNATSQLVGLNENSTTAFSPPTIISSFQVSSQ